MMNLYAVRSGLWLCFTLILFSLLIIQCLPENQADHQTNTYLRWVGDSVYDPKLDDSEFEICRGENWVRQYFHYEDSFSFEGEKTAVVDHFMGQFKSVDSNESGWIRIRFIVNCKGETGRFRLTSSNNSYKPYRFDDRINYQLLNLTKSLRGWKVQDMKGITQDYYQYLVFKIENGQITEILP